MLGKFVYHTLPKVSRDDSSMSEKDRSRSLNQRRKEALYSQSVPKMASNSSSTIMHHVALHSLNHSRQVAALTKDQHLKIVRWHRAPPLRTLCTNT